MARGSAPSANTAVAASPAAKLEDCGPGFHAGRERRPADITSQAPRLRYAIDDRGKALSDDRKRNLIVEKLDKGTYKTYSKHVLPLKP
ncbi:hypothetical protein ANCCAN_06341 [Ancylostoma caninum]|uniref:DUF7083 domain-containing protein n=1 Tax=Ancylostoma caninum TaxID=29170 RepID=A0A368GX22_ANCCA|nr:hypothetical protein ANCCAN_06341 [Ancylostoma caninum]